jgi:hypothetical protein
MGSAMSVVVNYDTSGASIAFEVLMRGNFGVSVNVKLDNPRVAANGFSPVKTLVASQSNVPYSWNSSHNRAHWNLYSTFGGLTAVISGDNDETGSPAARFNGTAGVFCYIYLIMVIITRILEYKYQANTSCTYKCYMNTLTNVT